MISELGQVRASAHRLVREGRRGNRSALGLAEQSSGGIKIQSYSRMDGEYVCSMCSTGAGGAGRGGDSGRNRG